MDDTQHRAEEAPGDAQKPKPHAIGVQVIRFAQHIDSLADTLPLTMTAIHASRTRARESFEEFLGKFANTGAASENSSTVMVQIPAEQYHRFEKLRNRYERWSIAGKAIPRSFVVSLVGQFDSFLGGLIRALFYSRPELLNASDRALTFKDLGEFHSLADAREFVVEKEVEALIRKSHPEQFDWMEKKFGVKLRETCISWPVFVEVTERRNLFVHCDGVISNQYLKVCGEHGVPIGKDYSIGRELSVPLEYFTSAYEVVFEIGIKLAHVLWRKLQAESRKEADTNLISICFDLLREGKYALAKNVLDFAAEALKNYSSEESRRIFVINRVQAYKWSGEDEKARELLKSEDWTACADLFQLAVAVLDEKYDLAVKLMRKIGAKERLNKGDYREWPLFREFRKCAEFALAFEEIFGEPFNTVEAELKPERRFKLESEESEALSEGGEPDTIH